MNDRDLELLSAYLDNQLPEAEKTRLEHRLKSEPELKETLAGLRATVRAMRSLPQVKIPRSFTLDPKLYAARRPAAGFASAYGLLRLGTALATVLFVVALAGDFLTRSGAQQFAVPSAALAPAPAEQSQAVTDTPAIAALSAPANSATGEAGVAATEAPGEPPQGPTQVTGLFLEGPTEGGGGGGGGIGGGGGGGGEGDVGAPPAPETAAGVASALPAEGTPSAERQAADTTAETQTPEAESTSTAATKSVPEETQAGVAQANAPTEAAPTPPPAPAVQPEAASASAPVDWLRPAQIGLAILALGLGLATLWYRTRR